MTPEEGFESAQFLVSWAHSQRAKLEGEIASFLQPDAATVVKEVNLKTGGYDTKIKFRPVPPVVRGLANNIVKDLRDALDQATNAASILVSGTHGKCRHFPFAQSPEDFDKAVRLNQCKNIPEALRPVLKGFEPYPTGDWSGGNNYLRLLGTVSGPHKHRFTLASALNARKLEIQGPAIIRAGHGGGHIFPMGTVAKNNELVVVTVGPGGDFEGNINFSSFVAFADTKLKGVPVCRFLLEVSQRVGEIVQDLQTEAFEIGPPS